MSSRRPIIVAGPIERNSNPRSSGSVDSFGFGAAGLVATCASNKPASPIAAAGSSDRRWNLSQNGILSFLLNNPPISGLAKEGL